RDPRTETSRPKGCLEACRSLGLCCLPYQNPGDGRGARTRAPAGEGHLFPQEVSMMMRLIVRLLINAAALAAAAWAVPGIDYVGGGGLGVVGVIFGFGNG